MICAQMGLRTISNGGPSTACEYGYSSIFAKMTICNSAGNTEFLAKSNFNSSANFGPLMTNGGTLEW